MYPLRQISELVSITKGKKHSLTDDGTGLYRYIQIDDLRNDDDIKYTNDTKGTFVEERDIVIAWDGANAGTIGYGLTGLIGSTLARLHIRTKDVFPEYLGRFLQSKFNEIRDNCTGATIPHVSKNHLVSIQVPIPSLATQKHISRVLEQADQLRKQAQQMESELNQLAQSLFLEMFGDPIENTKKWQTASIGDISPQKGEIVDGPFGSSLKPNCYVESGVRVIRNYNIKPGRFDDSEYKFVTQEKYEEIKRSNVIPGDILISTKGTVGNLCICPELQGSSVLSASGTVRWRMTNKDWVSSFIVFQAQMPSYQAYIARSTGGAVQKYLNLSGIRDLKLIAPPYDLQRAFVRKLDEVAASKRTLASNAANLNMLFQSLMQRAFNGELTAPGTKAA